MNQHVNVQITQNESISVVERAEELLLAVLIDTPSLCDKCAEAVHSQGFSKPELLQIFDAICDLGNNTSIDKLNDRLDQPAQSVLARIITAAGRR